MEHNIFELTNPQKSIWYMEQYFKGTAINNICGSLTINEIVDFEMFKKSINLFVKLNKSFHIRLFMENSIPKQYFCNFKEFDIEIIDIKSHDQILDIEKEMVSIPFNMIESPLFKFKIFRLPNGHGGFVVNTHHLISDAATIAIIGSNIARIYTNLKNNTEIDNNVPSYIDYIHTEQEYLLSDKFKKDEEYWNEKFKTIPDIASIPASFKNNSNYSSKSKRELFILPKDIVDKIRHLCSKEKISVFNFFMAVYSLYIGRVSNLDEFVIGTPILNRTNFKEKHTSGMFISTVPLKIKISNNSTFTEFVCNIAKDSLSMLRHQRYPYQYLLENLRKEYENVPNMYDNLISYQITKTIDKTIDLPYSVHWVEANEISCGINIHIHDNDDSGNLTMCYDYLVDKYSSEDIIATHNRVLYIVNQLLDNINICMKDIEIVTPEEKIQLKKNITHAIKSFNYCDNIFDQIKINSSNNLSSIAIETDKESLTYGELIKRVNKLSNYFLKMKIPLYSNIGIFASRNIDTIIAILAIINIDCTYVPIDPEYPIDRINYIVDNSKINCILTSNMKYVELVKNNNINFININYKFYSKLSDLFFYNTNRNKNNNLYIVFTSGSTGNPKGITLSHKNMLNLVYFEKESTNILNGNNRILQFATMSFDVSYQEIFSSLLSNSTLVLVNENIRKDINKLSDYILNKKVDTLFIPPAYLRILTEDSIIRNKFKTYVKNIITAGEQLIITEGIDDLIKSGITINNHYGPAETHVCTNYIINKNNIENKSPIGYPISNCAVYILNSLGNLCPKNVIGEIAISGDCVGNGYFNNANLTNQKFVKDIFSNKRMYLTGDLGYMDSNNCVYYIGRSDFQVKINGFRIELEEIDKILMQNKNINNCISIIKEFNNKKYIITYFCSTSKVNTKIILSYLKNKLPIYMIPTKLINLPFMPLTANGKIDRKSLPDFNFIENINDFILPKTDDEIKLANIWKDLFNVDKISTNYNFFEIGGDSLLSIKLCAKILDIFKVDVTVKDIFDNPVFSDLLCFIRTFNKSLNNIIQKSYEANSYPTSSAQKRIYYSSQLAGKNSIVYNLPGGIILDKVPDIDKLEKCFNKLIDRHESLRTYFELENGEVVQKIVEKIKFKLDVDSANYEDINSCFKSFAKPFNLNIAPLFRAKLIKFENDKCLLLFDMHHIISDGTSLQILVKDLCALYNNDNLEKINLTYKDFAVWENENINTELFEDSKNYWISQFNEDIPVLDIPTNYPRPSKKSFEGAKIYKTLEKDLTNNIYEICKKLNVTPYMLLLSAYYILLSKYSRQDDIVIGSPIIGRDNSQLSNIIGMFVNNLSLRTHIDENLSFSTFLKNIKNICLKAFEHQSYPFDKLVNDLNLKRDLGRNPLFDTMFIYQNDGYFPVSLDNIKSEYYMPDANISKFDLSLEVIPDDNTFKLNFEYCTKLFNESFIDNLSDHYINILKEIISNIDISISNITMLSDIEKNRILYTFNNTIVDYPSNISIVNLFEEQVKNTPNNIAVVFENEKLTYEELNHKANQLAHAILNQGINTGDVIALLLDKSLEMIISILAVLKCNCAFLPIDINYPQERIDYMLKDSHSSLLISTGLFASNIDYAIKIMNVDLKESTMFNDIDKIENCDLNYSSDNLTYIMYTSGSTGTPKGVMIKQKSIIRLIKNQNFIKFDKQEHILQSGSIVFDASTFEIWSALLNGFELYIIKKEDLLNPDTFQDYLIKNNITVLWLTAPLFNQLVEEIPHMFKNVKYLLTGGDALSPKHVNMARVANPNLQIINGYGPTENTTFSVCFNIDKTYENNIPIGYPISNSTCYVCSNNGNLLPVGVPGELYVGGDGLAIGYLNNTSLTNEKFINFPYTKNKVYKTGDLVRWLPGGVLEFLGRIDSQVKIRGFRVELNEINLKVSKYEGIKESITIVKEINGEKVICCYFVSNNKIALENLRSYLKTFLPPYMIPTYFMALDKLPINTNGKIDKNALPTNFKHSVSVKLEKPVNKTEQLILDIYKKVLNMDEISTTDDFFEIGGDSLLAMKLQVEFVANNLDITYSDIFKYSSVKELSNFINSSNEEEKENFSNYNKYDVLLKNNTISNINNIEYTSIGNVLLTGVTGFLGAHVLDSFIKNTDSNIYCLIRGKDNISAIDRLKNILHFYFEDKYDKYIGNRINLVEGDISKDNMNLSLDKYNSLGYTINTVIHCAALVKHYGTFKDFESINISGTKLIIEFCNKFKLRLLHISTISVSGNAFAEDSYVENNFTNDVDYDETNFYIGQNLSNLYVKSKFIAEKLVLDAISNGLQAYILRMGNLTSRFSEGKFQQNHFENAFVNRFKSMLQIKYAPDYLLSGYVEFTPIDYCGDAIIKLASHYNKKFTVFHLLNEKIVTMDRLFEILKDLHVDINLVSGEQFKNIIENILQDSNKKSYLEGIINDFNKDKKLVYESPVKIKSDFTKIFLEKIGFSWPDIDKNYIYNYLKYLSDIGYFNINLA